MSNTYSQLLVLTVNLIVNNQLLSEWLKILYTWLEKTWINKHTFQWHEEQLTTDYFCSKLLVLNC